VLDVIDAGVLTTVQDLGRVGYAALGVPRSGALDAPALRLANRLVGNDEHAAGLEITLTGCRLRCLSSTFAAVTGAPAPVWVDDRPAPFGAAFGVPAGATLRIGRAAWGVRSYLALGGGLAVQPVLGSRSTDTLSGLGPAPLRAGDRLPLGTPAGPPAPVDATPVGPPLSTVELRLRLGPRDDWFTPAALHTLFTGAYTLSPTGNRVGARLTGPALDRARPGELPSEGVVLGAVQVPADGLPLIFLADHPTTGGYPVVGVVHPADLALLAQARPGTTVRLRRSP
jgi:biotin-dependent carboxylase-like uncharacterized protein